MFLKKLTYKMDFSKNQNCIKNILPKWQFACFLYSHFGSLLVFYTGCQNGSLTKIVNNFVDKTRKGKRGGEEIPENSLGIGSGFGSNSCSHSNSN